MTKQEMRTKLTLNDGVGVEIEGTYGSIYYFYEEFENAKEDCISRAYRQLGIENIKAFYSTTWAKQSQFKEYIELFHKMEPETERYNKHLEFLIKQLIKWSTLDEEKAKKQITSDQVSYLSFTS